MSALRRDLAGRDLTGELPRDNRVWGALPAVTSVNLANNSIYGWVPPELSDLQQIQSLDLAHNTFQGPLAGMANLSRLENVSLTGNEMTGMKLTCMLRVGCDYAQD